jgi:hypothetical protein
MHLKPGGLFGSSSDRRVDLERIIQGGLLLPFIDHQWVMDDFAVMGWQRMVKAAVHHGSGKGKFTPADSAVHAWKSQPETWARKLPNFSEAVRGQLERATRKAEKAKRGGGKGKGKGKGKDEYLCVRCKDAVPPQEALSLCCGCLWHSACAVRFYGGLWETSVRAALPRPGKSLSQQWNRCSHCLRYTGVAPKMWGENLFMAVERGQHITGMGDLSELNYVKWSDFVPPKASREGGWGEGSDDSEEREGSGGGT